MHTEFYSENLKERDYLGDTDLDGSLLKCNFK